MSTGGEGKRCKSGSAARAPPAHKGAAGVGPDKKAEEQAARLSAEANREAARIAAARVGLQTRTRRELASIAKGLEVHRARSGQASLGLTASSVGCSSAEDLVDRISALCRDPATSQMVSILAQSALSTPS